MAKKETQGKDPILEARRKFLAKAGKFSIATPPAIAILLSEANRNYALAVSGGGAPPGGSGGRSSGGHRGGRGGDNDRGGRDNDRGGHRNRGRD